MFSSSQLSDVADTLSSSLSSQLLLVYLLTIVLPLFVGAVGFFLDYQLLKSKCDLHALKEKRASLSDCRDFFLRPPSSMLEFVKVTCARILFDVIGIFYETDSKVKETEMTLCASWSVVIVLYLATCQMEVFSCVMAAYVVYQISLSLQNKTVKQEYVTNDRDNAKYELMREACSGNLKSFDELMKGVDNCDHVSAGFVIFILTSNESNIDPDLQKATSIANENLDTFLEEASQGDIFAQAIMSFLHMRGIHVPQDDIKALEYGLKSVKTGHPFSNLILGWVYLARQKKDPEMSYKYLKLSAKAGLASAQNSMGALNLLESDKYAQNPKKALYWFKQAALQNLRGAEFNLGALYNSDTLLDCEPAPSFFSFGGKSRQDVRDGLRNDAIYWLMLASQHGHRLADAELQKAESNLGSNR